MKLEYHWDRELFEALLRYRARQILRYIDLSIKEREMGTPADIQKLIGRMQRAQALTDRAAGEGDNAETVMNNFEQTVNRFSANFGAMSEYDKQLQAMMQVTGNGGPPLQDVTFSSSAGADPGSTVPPPNVLTTMLSSIHHDTGDPIR